MSQNVNNTRKVRITSQQIALLTLTDGAQAVVELHNKPGCAIAVATFDGALEHLDSQPEHRAALAGIREDLFGSDGPGERGRPAAKVGESRRYRVQQVNDGDTFIRLPVALLGGRKGQEVTVSFGDGTITVRM